MSQNPWPLKPALSWALYDLANTIYSAAVVTVFLPLYIHQLTRVNLIMGISATAAMILAGLLAPPLGAVTDETGKTKRYLITSTAVTCIAIFLIGFPIPVTGILACFIAAHFFYHLALVYYNSLLPVVAPAEKQGWISGLGVGLGYAGVLVALPVGYWVEKTFGTRFVFPAVALIFLAGTIPLLLYVPERTVASARPFRIRMILDEFRKGARTLYSLPLHPRILYFLLGNFFIQEAVNASILWLSVFLKFSFHMTQGALILTLVGTNLTASAAGFLWGWVTGRIGSFKATWLAALALALALAFLAIAHNPYLALTALLTLGSLGLAGTWVAGRRLLIELAPADKIGEYFGLYGMSTKLACFSMAIFALLADHFGFRAAIAELLVMLGIGLLLLAKVKSTSYA